MKPTKELGSRLCFALTPDGLTAYGNPQALRSMARWLEWLAKSDPAEHYECHATLALEEEAVLLGDQKAKSVWVLVDPSLSDVLNQGKIEEVDGEKLTHSNFEVTFVTVSDEELDQMKVHQDSGILPPGWGRQS